MSSPFFSSTFHRSSGDPFQSLSYRSSGRWKEVSDQLQSLLHPWIPPMSLPPSQSEISALSRFPSRWLLQGPQWCLWPNPRGSSLRISKFIQTHSVHYCYSRHFLSPPHPPADFAQYLPTPSLLGSHPLHQLLPDTQLHWTCLESPSSWWEGERGCFYAQEMLLREFTSHLLNTTTSSSSRKPSWTTFPSHWPFSEFTASTFWHPHSAVHPVRPRGISWTTVMLIINVSYIYAFVSSNKL